MPRRNGYGCLGLPAMLAAFAFVAFAKAFGGVGILVGAVAVLVVYLIIGLVVVLGRR